MAVLEILAIIAIEFNIFTCHLELSCIIYIHDNILK